MAVKTRLGESTSLADEYQKSYPNIYNHVRFIRLIETIYLEQMLKEKSGNLLIDDDFTNHQNLLKRWNTNFLYPHLIFFLGDENIQFGDIYIRPDYPHYKNVKFQTMRNTSITNQVYEFGKTYVGFGYVDLFQILWGHYQQSGVDETLTFYGYDKNMVVVLRSKLIYIIFKYYQESEINTRCALQIWFSSCWDVLTLNAFRKLVKDIFEDPGKYGVVQEELALLKAWKKNKLSTAAAQKNVFKEIADDKFDDVIRMKAIQDRMIFSRYNFTGCIFIEEDTSVCGNPTMFTSYEGQTRMTDESFFKAVDLRAHCFKEEEINPDSLFHTISSTTVNHTVRFRELVRSGKIVCHLKTKIVDPLDLEFAAEIKDLKPYGIDWSNIPDYLEKRAFIRFARACSTEETIHTVHFLNWQQYVYGSCHVDWVEQQGKLNRLYNEFLNDLRVKLEEQKRIEGEKSLLNFFNGARYMFPLNGVNLMLSSMFRNTFEDFFLSDENGEVLNRLHKKTCDGVETSFFEQSMTLITSAFSFNERIDLKKIRK